MGEETTTISEKDVQNLLCEIFGDDDVIPEWDVAKNSRDAYTRSLYCPRVDFAVKPLNIDANLDWNNEQINRTYNMFQWLIGELKSKSNKKRKNLELNENPRCFLVVEIENETDPKWLLGTIVNSSALGKVGIVIAWNPRVFRSLLRIVKYLEYIESVGKAKYSGFVRNVLIVKKEDFFEVCQRAVAKLDASMRQVEKGRDSG